MSKISFGRDVQGYNAYAPAFSTNSYSASMTIGSEQTITVPSNFKNWIAVFAYEPGSVVWVALNTTAAVPAGASLAATSSELIPSARMVSAGDVIHVITASTTAEVSVSLYAVS